MLQIGKDAMIAPGDVFVARIPDGRYTAVRVLRVSGKSSLICTCDYLKHERPCLDDPALLDTVVQRRFFYNGETAITWLDGTPPKSFKFLGNIPLTRDETDLDCSVYSGKWGESTGNEAVLEWRWLHDRPAFEEEVRKKHEERLRRWRLPQKPKKMIDEDEFWAIIDLLAWEHLGNDEQVLAPAIKALASKSKTYICRFEERVAFHLYQLDTKAHARNTGEGSNHPDSDDVSADGFLYARCVAVANGKEFYEAVLKDPSKMPKAMEFESLLGLARDAYELKTGEEFEYNTGCSYESFSNHDGWRDESRTNG